MAAESKYKMSQERYDEIKEELPYLETVREKEVSELIKEARSFGDLSENSEYDEAKTEQGKLYSKIAELDVYKRQPASPVNRRVVTAAGLGTWGAS